ncbi:hypothetical protein ACFWFI_30860 [Streptomyces sp. NPDC060209]|uniref:hypothetical protein n=1 Tax=Streptomyces TaxID=1883 RepID=UPI0022EDCE4B|nr:hypothetical protein [Streptomyces olivaceus]GHJ05616.1 hypothetical protein TPA0906_74810 [Streptomyces olivaceus]
MSASFTPPRLLILAAPAGIYPTITLSPETGWTWSAAIGAVIFALVLFGPALIRSAAKASAVRAATKKAKAAETSAKKEGKK